MEYESFTLVFPMPAIAAAIKMELLLVASLSLISPAAGHLVPHLREPPELCGQEDLRGER